MQFSCCRILSKVQRSRRISKLYHCNDIPPACCTLHGNPAGAGNCNPCSLNAPALLPIHQAICRGAWRFEPERSGFQLNLDPAPILAAQSIIGCPPWDTQGPSLFGQAKGRQVVWAYHRNGLRGHRLTSSVACCLDIANTLEL